ncbi:MAG: hypothetical protein Kow00124_18650 [Anaerolineae bacterium]
MAHTPDSTRAARIADLTSLARHPGLWVALIGGLALKAVILITGASTFDADEAIVGLMARHILMRGELPVFFYGQRYMGAIDAYLTVPFFAVMGPTVLAMRLLQVTLYLGVLVSTYAAALRLSRSRFSATAAALLIAMPPVLFSTYTTASLGSYVETLLLNNLLLLIGWGILSGERDTPGRWLLAGLLAGIGWWGMALIVVTAAPLALLGLWHFRRRIPWRRVGLLLAGFVVGALPWIIATLSSAREVLGDLAGVRYGAVAAGFEAGFGPAERLVSLLVLNLPALFGLRPPWSTQWNLLPVGLIVTALYALALLRALRRALSRREPPDSRLMLGSLLGGWALLLALFVGTSFGIDPTGRYLLPLYPLLAVLTGEWLGRVREGVEMRAGRRGLWIAPLLLALLIGYNAYGNLRAVVENPPGLTTQFDPISHIPHDHDAALIAFLDQIGVDRGYSNYWVAYRFAFLTGERVLLAPRLPYKADLDYTYLDDRYPHYTALVRQAERIVYVTSNHPVLDEALTARLDALGVTYRVEHIGPYTVFYDLSEPVTPEQIGPFGAVSGVDPLG